MASSRPSNQPSPYRQMLKGIQCIGSKHNQLACKLERTRPPGFDRSVVRNARDLIYGNLAEGGTKFDDGDFDQNIIV